MPDQTPLDAPAVAAAIEKIAGDVAREHPVGQPLNVVGILTRGETLATRLRRTLAERGVEVRPGTIDVTLYRDDLSEIGPRPLVRPTDLHLEVDGIPMLLVDDVLYTGRSVRAALGVIAEFGRPAYVKLAVLVDRGGRELPIQADYVGQHVEVPAGGRINVRLNENDGRDAVEIEHG